MVAAVIIVGLLWLFVQRNPAKTLGWTLTIACWVALIAFFLLLLTT